MRRNKIRRNKISTKSRMYEAHDIADKLKNIDSFMGDVESWLPFLRGTGLDPVLRAEAPALVKLCQRSVGTIEEILNSLYSQLEALGYNFNA